MKNVLRHVEDVNVAINEYITRHTVNRNIRKLLENDNALNDLYIKIFGGVDISEYVDNRAEPYRYGSVVWFQDRNKKLWLLQCVWEENSNSPQRAIDSPNEYGMPDFERFGWEDLNEHVDIMKLGLETQIARLVDGNIDRHQTDAELHKFGDLTSASMPHKVLKRDLSNIDENRETLFFPYKTGHFTTDAILDGTYRIWDCGVIEFNVVFRLGYVGVDELGYEVIQCNDVRFRTSSARTSTSLDYQENTKYFYSPNDMKIFTNPDTVEVFQSVIGNTKQRNRNNYVNTYSAKLDLFGSGIDFNGRSIGGFADLNYMVFTGDMMSQDSDTANGTVFPSANAMTWCDRTRKSITALYITFPRQQDSGRFGKYGGLVSNSFSCQVIGKWK